MEPEVVAATGEGQEQQPIDAVRVEVVKEGGNEMNNSNVVDSGSTFNNSEMNASERVSNNAAEVMQQPQQGQMQPQEVVVEEQPTQGPPLEEQVPQEQYQAVDSARCSTAKPIIPAGPPPPPPPPLDAFDQPIYGAEARALAADLIHKYFTTQSNPLVRHHIESYDQFLQRDLKAIIVSNNPLVIYKNPKARMNAADFMYKVEIFIGGEEGNDVFIGTPTIALQGGEDVRILYPNEARLRNLTYAVQVEANVLVRVTIKQDDPENPEYIEDIHIKRMPLCNFPLMLHSTNCMLHGKSTTMLTQMGECAQDQGGYFIVDGSEKVLVTRQDGAFNTLWIDNKRRDPSVEYIASLSSLNPKTREVKRTKFYWTRELTTKSPMSGKVSYKPSVLEVGIPFVLKPIPIFVLFRALGIQSDKDILQLIFPDFHSPETKYLADLLIPSINAAAPFLDTFSAVEYIKSLTKGFSVFHVLDIIHNHLFPHVEDLPGARAAYLGDCVRRILRVVKKLDTSPSRDDTRNQRLISSGFLCQMLFQNIYKNYLKVVKRRIDEIYVYNESVYTNRNFTKIFSESNRRIVFEYGYLTEGIMRGFKGKWSTGPEKVESGVLQELSRLSYLDFMSHLRRAILNFDVGIKLPEPRRLHPSQYGYFCTSETPSGSHIGVTKNLSIMTIISTGVYPDKVLKWLYTRGSVLPCEYITPQLATSRVPVYLNSGIIGYTAYPKELVQVLRMMKRGGFLPPLSSNGFIVPERRIFINLDDGRPLRPLIICDPIGLLPSPKRFSRQTWRELVVGMLRPDTSIGSRDFVDPLEDAAVKGLQDYLEFFHTQKDNLGVIEYLDPYEQNEVLIASFPEHITKQTTHMEVHPSTILGLLGNMIPYPNHNQSPRNQLSASQSKQGLSLYATNFQNRFDNTANVLCYGQAPLSRTIYQDYIGNGQMSYGQNVILAMGMYGGYNQEDGIIMNADALARGQFRSINYRSYEAYEEDDSMSHTETRIGNPAQIPEWMDLKTNLDYSKLDETGIVKVGEYVDQNTVIVGRYMRGERGQLKDASVTPQVWTRGRVEKVVVTVNNLGFRLVKIRVAQDRVPELGDKFSNRHGQKGTINVLYRSTDMPRTADGITPDMIMNPTAIPSRMTIGQILEMMFGNVSAVLGAIGNVTAFMNDGSPHEIFGKILEDLGLNKMCNQVLYNGMTGEMMTVDIYMGVVYGMRLKHMTEDKWNARGQGRKEQRTHQPTGGRGNEGGMKIGEMERDAIIAHGISDFQLESYTVRSDGTHFVICNGCGTIPIYNEKQDLYICSLCDGPIQYSGENANNLEPIPPPIRSATSFSKVGVPYATKLLGQELETFLNIGMRYLTTRDVTKLKGMDSIEELTEVDSATASQPLKPVEYPEYQVPELPVVVPPPTNADIQRTIAEIQASTHSLMEENVAAAAFGQTQAQAGPQANQQATMQAMVTNVQQTPQLAQQPQASEIVLQNPVGIPTQFNMQPQQPTEIISGEGGEPMIMIDTSPEALAAEGLVGDQPSPRPMNMMMYPQSVRKVRRPAPRQQMNPYMNAQMGYPMEPQQQQYQPQQQQMGGEEGGTSGGSTTNATVQVVKLG